MLGTKRDFKHGTNFPGDLSQNILGIKHLSIYFFAIIYSIFTFYLIEGTRVISVKTGYTEESVDTVGTIE